MAFPRRISTLGSAAWHPATRCQIFRGHVPALAQSVGKDPLSGTRRPWSCLFPWEVESRRNPFLWQLCVWRGCLAGLSPCTSLPVARKWKHGKVLMAAHWADLDFCTVENGRNRMLGLIPKLVLSATYSSAPSHGKRHSQLLRVPDRGPFPTKCEPGRAPYL